MDTSTTPKLSKTIKNSSPTTFSPAQSVSIGVDDSDQQESDQDWVKETEEKIELLQNQTSAVLRKFAESYESLWEDFCEKITELNELTVGTIASLVGETARAEDEGRLLKDELSHTQSLTSSLASKLLPEQ